MRAATAGRYTCALIGIALLFQPVEPAPFASTEDPEPFLNRAILEARVERVLSAVRPGAAASAAPLAIGGPEEEPAAAAPAEDPVKLVTVEVRQGQSLWSLAAEYGTTIEEILDANHLADGTVLRIGQALVIPSGSAASPRAAAPAPRKTSVKLRPGARIITIRLYEGQTLWDVSQTYGPTIDEIVTLNGLESGDYVRAGQRIRVPVYNMASIAPRRVAQSLAGSAASSVAALAQGFIWPARGRLTSRFGWRRYRHHDGIDIAAPYGAPVTAARDGVVVFSGWYAAYGKAVIVDHGSGLQTLYGHNSRLLVRSGQRVTKGELIAHVGSTGRSTGPHLHFEVRINGRPVNPIKYL